MSDSTEKSKHLKSCGPAVIQVLTKHPGCVSPARTAFQASQDEENSRSSPEPSRDESDWFHDESKYVSVSVCVCVAECVICCAAAPAGPGIR